MLVHCKQLFTTLYTLIQSLKQEGEHARVSLKVLETLTYSCTSPSDLNELTVKVEELIKSISKNIPRHEGLILRPEAIKAMRKRAQKIGSTNFCHIQ